MAGYTAVHGTYNNGDVSLSGEYFGGGSTGTLCRWDTLVSSVQGAPLTWNQEMWGPGHLWAGGVLGFDFKAWSEVYSVSATLIRTH